MQAIVSTGRASFPVGWHTSTWTGTFLSFFLFLSVHHLLTVFFHSLEVAITNQLQEFLVPWFCPTWDDALGRTRHLMKSIVFKVFVKHLLPLSPLPLPQGWFADGVDKTMLYGLAKIGPSIHSRTLRKSKPRSILTTLSSVFTCTRTRKSKALKYPGNRMPAYTFPLSRNFFLFAIIYWNSLS